MKAARGQTGHLAQPLYSTDERLGSRKGKGRNSFMASVSSLWSWSCSRERGAYSWHSHIILSTEEALEAWRGGASKLPEDTQRGGG